MPTFPVNVENSDNSCLMVNDCGCGQTDKH